jgi:hypothetical protein
MRGVRLMVLVALAGSTRAGAQSRDLGSNLFFEAEARHDSVYRALFALSPVRSTRSPGIGLAFADTAPAKHHYVRNGAIIGGSIGFVAGAIGGGILSEGCTNCSIYRGAFTYIGAAGSAGAVVGSILGGVTGQVIGWLRH